MKTKTKIIIVGIIAISIPGIIIFGAIPLMIASNAYSGFIISSTSDSIFEEDFAKIPEVKFFIEKYPSYTTNHLADFLGWKIINYDANVGQNVVHLSVKKSVLHQGVKISAGCSVGGPHNYALNILDDDVMDYLKNNICLKKSEPDIIDSLKIPNIERDAKLDAGYKLYPGVGWVHPDDLGIQNPIYMDNPNNPDELILDIDSMIQVQKILDKCDYVQKLELGEIPTQNPDGSHNAVTSSLRLYNNGTHYIDTNTCKWVDSFESVTYNCFESTPIEQNWYSGPNYFDNSTHRLDAQQCEWIENED
ncbi:MAG: hypothetical protein ACW9W4_01125 [Candidatus Nitrosopumilus sp. bin_7KS]